MSETPVLDRSHQRSDDMVLAEQLVRPLRPVLPVERLVLLLFSHHYLRPGKDTFTDGDRAPAVDAGELKRFPDRWLRPGVPAAPTSARLPLLPSGPDGVRRLVSRRTRPSSLRTEGCLGPTGPRTGIQPR